MRAVRLRSRRAAATPLSRGRQCCGMAAPGRRATAGGRTGTRALSSYRGFYDVTVYARPGTQISRGSRGSSRDADFRGCSQDADLADSLRDADLADSLRDADLADSLRDADLADSLRDADLADSLRDADLADSLEGGLHDSVETRSHGSPCVCGVREIRVP
jgi:hypothetical protein